MKDKLKAMFLRNIGMKLVSIAIALVIWITIINLSDPKMTKTISGISIEQRNVDQVQSESRTYVSDSEKTVTIRINGVRSKIENLTASDFLAYVDFREMSSVYAVPVHVDAKDRTVKGDVEIVRQSVTMMTGKIVENYTRRKMIVVRFLNVPDGYYAVLDGEQDVKSEDLTGPLKTLDSFENLIAEVDVHGSTSDIIQKDVELTAFDKEGNPVDLTDVRIPIDTIKVNVLLLPIKSVPIELDISGVTTKDGHRVIRSKCSWTNSVNIAARQEILDSLDSLSIRYTKRDLISEYEDNDFSIARYLPDGAYVASDIKTISVYIAVEPTADKRFTIKVSDIQTMYLKDPLILKKDDADTVSFAVHDLLKDEADKLTEINLNLYLDLSVITAPGRYTVDLKSWKDVVEKSLREDDVKVNIYVVNDESDTTEGGNGNDSNGN
ncbi:MAG: hypothetical protein IJM57_03755 [Lachnospiraceae bacterium]|nr:hypothetical protein [Lachnospiraceae bacterium]